MGTLAPIGLDVIVTDTSPIGDDDQIAALETLLKYLQHRRRKGSLMRTTGDDLMVYR